MKVRVRIAPTPSGKLHLGTAHTALFNYLFARHNKGKFILRIDDSDPKRSKKEFEEDIIKSLKWLGFDWDEGPDIGGPYEPYRQSQRMDHYKPYIEKLLQKGTAYYCYCTQEELAEEKKRLQKENKRIVYSGKCSQLNQEQIANFNKQGRKPAVRLRVPRKIVSFIDPARGKISVNTNEFGDFIIARSDSSALLVLAITIDDLEMKITHAIRGEDYLNIVPKQIVIYEALGIEPPIFAHLPFVYAQDGSKLSKRHGATSVSEFKQMGYLPEAIFNYLVLLGWSSGDDRDILSKKEIIKLFTLEKVNTNSHRFDINKLNYINGAYIRNMVDKKLLQLIKQYSNIQLPISSFQKIVPLVKERIVKLADIDSLIDFFVKDIPYDKELLLKKADIQLVKKQLENIKYQISKNGI